MKVDFNQDPPVLSEATVLHSIARANKFYQIKGATTDGTTFDPSADIGAGPFGNDTDPWNPYYTRELMQSLMPNVPNATTMDEAGWQSNFNFLGSGPSIVTMNVEKTNFLHVHNGVAYWTSYYNHDGKNDLNLVFPSLDLTYGVHDAEIAAIDRLDGSANVAQVNTPSDWTVFMRKQALSAATTIDASTNHARAVLQYTTDSPATAASIWIDYPADGFIPSSTSYTVSTRVKLDYTDGNGDAQTHYSSAPYKKKTIGPTPTP
jgi:hypothetical protein